MPPLRERMEDIPLLVEHLLRRINTQLHKKVTKISKEAMGMLMNYQWPGNVRELENVLTRAVVLARGDILLGDYLLDLFSPGVATVSKSEQIESLDEMVRQHVLRALELTNWDMGKTCDILGISRPTLRKKIQKYQLNKWS